MALLDLDYPSPFRAWNVALVIGLVGSVLILALVVWMNESAKAPESSGEALVTPMEIAQAPSKPHSRPSPKPKPRRKTQNKSLKPIPTPDLGANLSGVDFGLPEIGLDSGMEERLLGENPSNAAQQEAFDTPPQAVVTGSFIYPPPSQKTKPPRVCLALGPHRRTGRSQGGPSARVLPSRSV